MHLRQRFAEFILKNGHRILNLRAHRLSEDEQAEVLARFYVRFVEKVDRLRAPDAIHIFLRQIGRRVLCEFFREQRKRSVEQQLAAADIEDSEIQSAEGDPLAVMIPDERQEVMRGLFKALQTLEPVTVRAFQLVYLEQLGPSAAARKIGCSRTTIFAELDKAWAGIHFFLGLAMLCGHVVNDEGKPVRSHVILRGSTMKVTREDRTNLRRDPFHLRMLPPGKYMLRIAAPGYTSQCLEISLSEGVSYREIRVCRIAPSENRVINVGS